MTGPLRVFLCLVGFGVASVASAQASAWFGTWKLKLTKPDEKPETLIYSDAGGGAMRMESVEDKSLLVTRFDGRPAATMGSGDGKGRALAIRAISPTRYSWTFLVDGKPVARGINTLAPDRRSFTEVAWPVAAPARKVTLVYERQ